MAGEASHRCRPEDLERLRILERVGVSHREDAAREQLGFQRVGDPGEPGAVAPDA
jgi:hypothetical protein